MLLENYLTEEVIRDPSKREYEAFDLARLLDTVFEPTQGCRVCILLDFDDPASMMKGFAYLEEDGFAVQKMRMNIFTRLCMQG